MNQWIVTDPPNLWRQTRLDLMVVTPEEFEKYRDVVGHVLYPIVREGKVLHEAARAGSSQT